MDDAKPSGQDMDFRTFDHALSFWEKVSPPLIAISGGEPTGHPDVIEFLEHAKSRKFMVLLFSNGLFLQSDLKDQILDLVHAVQIINDPKFYPCRVEDPKHEKIMYADYIPLVSPHGRAVMNKIPSKRIAPNCFNLRSAVRSIGLIGGISYLRAGNKMCTPAVNHDGMLSAGESRFCQKIGHVTDDLEFIEQKIINMKCSRCGLVDRLTPRQKRAIGELTD